VIAEAQRRKNYQARHKSFRAYPFAFGVPTIRRDLVGEYL
jgi:hypothetical protein